MHTRRAGPCPSTRETQNPVLKNRRFRSSSNPELLVLLLFVQANLEVASEKGTLNNFKNGILDGHATSVYRIGDSLVMGSRLFASWSTMPGNSPSELFYDNGDTHAMLEDVECSAGATSHTVFLSGGGNGQQMKEWGTATECDAGPAPLNATTKESPPVILLSGDSNLHMIVEEDSSYPSFLYSVWQPVLAGDGTNASAPAEMHHVFYVSSTTRLAEAIVSGVVNGIMSGGGCVDLLSQFSAANTTYDLGGMSRVAPFGEYPSFASVESIDDVEEIVEGVKVSDIGMISGLILMVVTGASFAGCLVSLKSRTSMDVFDRDAVIRAVALPNGQEADITSPALKIYVRHSEEARFGMVVSDDTARRRWINGCVKGVASAVTRSSPAKDGDGDDDDEPLPARGISRSWSLPRASFTRVSSDGGRPNLERPGEAPVGTPPPQSPTYVELIASPIPSLARGGSVLRGLPTFFSSSIVASRLDDSSTDRAHSSTTDHGPSSPGVSSRSMKGRAGSVLQSALHGKEAPPADIALPTTGGGVDIPAPISGAAHQRSPTSASVKGGAADTPNTAPSERDGITGKEEGPSEGAAEVVNMATDRDDEAVEEESTAVKEYTAAVGTTGVDMGPRNGTGGSYRAIDNADTEKAGDGVDSHTTVSNARKKQQIEGEGDAPCGDDPVSATPPANRVRGDIATDLPRVRGCAEAAKTE